MFEGEKDGGAGSSTGKEGEDKSKTADSGDEGAEDEDPEGDEPEGDEPPKGDLHKSKRWQKVHGELKAFKEAGLSPLQLKAALKRLDQYDKAAEELEAAEKAGDDDDPKKQELAKRRKAARKELYEIAPELAVLAPMAEKIDTYFTSLERRATGEMSKLMKEAGLPVGDKNLASMSEVLASIIESDKELYFEYVGDPRNAVRQAWAQFKGDFEAAARRTVAANVQKNKQNFAGLPKTHKPGGSPEMGGKKVEGPKDLKEARKRAEARLAAME